MKQFRLSLYFSVSVVVKAFLLLLAVCLFALQPSMAQQYMNGKVIRPSGEPIPRALVKIDQNEPVLSDTDGKFQIRLEAGSSLDSLHASKDDYTLEEWELRGEEIVVTMRYTPVNSPYPTIYYIKGRIVDHRSEGVANLKVSLPESTALQPASTDPSGYFAIKLNRKQKVRKDMIFLVNNAQVDSRYFTLRPDANSVIIKLPEKGLEGIAPAEKNEEQVTEASADEENAVLVFVADSVGTEPLTNYVIVYREQVFKTDKEGYIQVPKNLLETKGKLEAARFALNAGDSLIALTQKEEGTWQINILNLENADDSARQESGDTTGVEIYTEQVNQTLDIIEEEKRQLALNGAKLSGRIERLASQLRNTEDLTPEQTRQLRMEINRLRDALRENEKAFKEAQERTRNLLRQVNDVMQETEKELQRTAAEREADQRRLLLVSGLVIFFGVIAFFFYRNSRRIQKQKNELERVNRNMDLLGQIGRSLTSKLSLATISQEVYNDVNALMDANIFALGVYESERERLYFPASIEKGNKLSPYYYDLDAKAALLSVRSLKNKEEIIIRDFEREHVQYTGESFVSQTEDLPASVVYMPLVLDGKPIGVLTVQSYERDAYTEYHLSILRNLAVYIAIAVENAKVYEEIASQNRKITDSINYAKRIQSSIFPEEQVIQDFFPDYFIFYRPRDIVSGDFYYFQELDNGKMVVAGIDCTGHGVPGGFMSLIGHELLNDLIVRQQLDNPAEILNQMHQGVVRLLHQDKGEAAQDGMEVTLCVFSKDHTQVQMASSHMPLMIYNSERPGGVLEIKGDRLSVGGMYYDKNRESFTLHTIDLLPKDRLYFFSDGLQDQFGGPSNRKFLKKRLRKMLADAQKEPNMKAQHDLITKRFEDWKKGYSQIDDILLIGLEVSPPKKG